MCGIAGILLPTLTWVPKGQIEAMTGSVTHRGPDGVGYHRDRGVALGHRRLEIIDLAGGAQPLCNEDETVWVSFNGEIYNFKELRRDLVSRGHRFATQSDTEVLVHAYEQWGDALVEHLNGMFAFAIWDARENRCLLARDRMGQKPLYYTQLDDGRLVFGSEAKAVVAHPDVKPAVDTDALAVYLTYEYLPGSLSMFRGLRKLPPGFVLTYSRGSIQLSQYWDLPFDQSESGHRGSAPISMRRAEELFVSAFERSVRRRLFADVPLGIFLSGGIDSSAVTAMVTRILPPEQVRTFSIGFEDKSFDESDVARRVANRLGTDHHEQTFSARAMLDVLPEVIDKLDEPFGDASLLPTYLLSKFTRQHVKVALGGDGGDELLMGYPTFGADLVALFYRRLPSALRRFVERQVASLPVDTSNFSLDFIAKSFLANANADDAVRHPSWLGSFIPESGDDPLQPELRRRSPFLKVMSHASEPFHSAPNQDRLQRLSYQYCKTYLAEDILTKVDRASMAVSLEVRAPFLDHELVELITALPAHTKLRRAVTSKAVLRRAFRKSLPRDVLTRKKKGFGIPVAKWLKGPLKPQLLDLLAPDRIKRAGFLRHEVTSRLVDEHLKGRRDNRKKLWTLMCFELWRDHYNL